MRYSTEYRMVSRNLIVVEKWVAWKNVLDLRRSTRSALDYKHRMNLDGR